MPQPAQIFMGTFVSAAKLGKGLQIYPDHALSLDSRGFILDFVAQSSDVGAELIQLSNNATFRLHTRIAPVGAFFLPTFCDLHLHAPQYLYLGTGLHLPLMEWLNEYAYKAEERLDADPHGLGKRVYTSLARRLIQNGTSAALLFGTIKGETNIVLAEAFQAVGVRGFVGKLSMDQSSRPTYVESSVADSLAAARSFIQRCNGIVAHLSPQERLVEPVITPRFVPTCSDELLAGLGKLSNIGSVKIQSHMHESREQAEWVKSENGIEDVEVFHKHGLLTPRTVQAHCTYLPSPLPDTLSLLKAQGTSIAHCPLSNAYLSALPFPLREALDAGVKVGLGSDVAGGYDLNLANAMRQAVITSRMREGARAEHLQTDGTSAQSDSTGLEKKKLASLAVHWTDALHLATRGGAEVLGLSSGVFASGAAFDAQLIELVDRQGRGIGKLDFFDPVDHINEENIEKWWCLGTEANRTNMWVQGRELKLD